MFGEVVPMVLLRTAVPCTGMLNTLNIICNLITQGGIEASEYAKTCAGSWDFESFDLGGLHINLRPITI